MNVCPNVELSLSNQPRRMKRCRSTLQLLISREALIMQTLLVPVKWKQWLQQILIKFHSTFSYTLVWWRHLFSVSLSLCAGNSPGIGEFFSQRPATRSFDVCFDLRMNKRLSKQWRNWRRYLAHNDVAVMIFCKNDSSFCEIKYISPTRKYVCSHYSL